MAKLEEIKLTGSSEAEQLLVNLMFKLDVKEYEGKLEKINDRIYILLQKAKVNGENIPYPLITEYIYIVEEYNLASLTEQLEQLKKKAGKSELSDFYEKFLRHATLADTQKTYFSQAISDANNQLESITNTVDEVNVEFNDIRKNVYTDFISILGIFSALLFGLFVGFDTFKEIIAGISSNAKISRVTIMGALILLGLIALVFLLLSGIGALTNREIKTCCEDRYCNHNLYQKHPIFSISFLTLFFIIGLASIILIINQNGLAYEHPIVTVVLMMILFLFLFSFVLGQIRFPKNEINSKRKDDKE